MFLLLSGMLCVGLPGLLLGIGFSWFTHRCWRRGRAMLVVAAWLISLFSIAGGLTVVAVIFVNTPPFGTLYNAFVSFSVFIIAGGIPSGVIALVVSGLTYWLERADAADEWDEEWTALIMATGTFCGLCAGLLSLPLSMYVMDAFW